MILYCFREGSDVMYQIKRKKYNDDLIQFVDEIVTEYDYIFAKMKKRNDMTWKVRCSMCTILTTLGERQKRDEKIILIPRSKRFYSSSDNPIPEYLTFQAVQTAVLILQDKGIINFQKGYRTEGVESKTSSISLNSEYFSKDGLESYLKRISIFLPEANKSSVIRHKILFEVPAEVSKGLTFTRPTDHLTPREIYNLYDEADPVEWLEAEEKLLGLVPYDNRDIFNMFYRTQKKPKKKGKPKNKICVREEILQPSPKLERYNSFLVKEGLEKFKYRRIFSNNESWGGRFYSAINDIDRDLRKSLYRTEYTEVDFSSFSLNLIHLLEGEDKWMMLIVYYKVNDR
jgi:hypothetical protein